LLLFQPLQRCGKRGLAAAGKRGSLRQDEADRAAYLRRAGVCDVRMGDKRCKQEDRFILIGMRNAFDKLVPAALAAEQQLKARVDVIFRKRRPRLCDFL
jgi:hypothetical protein